MCRTLRPPTELAGCGDSEALTVARINNIVLRPFSIRSVSVSVASSGSVPHARMPGGPGSSLGAHRRASRGKDAALAYSAVQYSCCHFKRGKGASTVPCK